MPFGPALARLGSVIRAVGDSLLVASLSAGSDPWISTPASKLLRAPKLEPVFDPLEAGVPARDGWCGAA